MRKVSAVPLTKGLSMISGYDNEGVFCNPPLFEILLYFLDDKVGISQGVRVFFKPV